MDEYDPNVIARLVPLNERTRKVCAHPHNRSYYVPASFQDFPARKVKSRDATPFENDRPRDGRVKDTEPELKICFNSRPKDPSTGWVFGSDQTTCDIYCGENDQNTDYNIGRQTFSITMSKQGNVILNHLKNTNKTQVQYDSQNPGDRRAFSWIMFPFCKSIIVTSANLLKFQVIVANGKEQRGAYDRARANFLQDVETSMPSMPRLFIDNGLVSTPKPQPFYYLCRDRVLGRGAFGTVYVVIDVSTGIEYAGKKLFENISRNEVETLVQQNHGNIVRYVSLSNDDGPLLVMEYVRGGNIARPWLANDRPMWKLNQILSILAQSLFALASLHSGPNRVIHGNIKPENILVTGREPGPIIKLADFGLVKGYMHSNDRAVTLLYTAPEVFYGRAYDSKVDIWSLGVVIIQLLLDGKLPEPTKLPMQAPQYCKDIVAAVNNNYCYHRDRGPHMSTLVYGFVAQYMLQLDPRWRLSAEECLGHAAFLQMYPVQPSPRGAGGSENRTKQHFDEITSSKLPHGKEGRVLVPKRVEATVSTATYEPGVRINQILNGQGSKESSSLKPSRVSKADVAQPLSSGMVFENNQNSVPGNSQRASGKKPATTQEQEPKDRETVGLGRDSRVDYSCKARHDESPEARPSRVPPDCPSPIRKPDWFKHHVEGLPLARPIRSPSPYQMPDWYNDLRVSPDVCSNRMTSETQQKSKPASSTPHHDRQPEARASHRVSDHQQASKSKPSTPRHNQQDRKADSSNRGNDGSPIARSSLVSSQIHPKRVPDWYTEQQYDHTPVAGPSATPSDKQQKLKAKMQRRVSRSDSDTRRRKSSISSSAVEASSSGAISQKAATRPAPAASYNIQFTAINATNSPQAREDSPATVHGDDDDAPKVPLNIPLLNRYKDEYGAELMSYLHSKGEFPAEDRLLGDRVLE